jgi:hypothetical protein
MNYMDETCSTHGETEKRMYCKTLSKFHKKRPSRLSVVEMRNTGRISVGKPEENKLLCVDKTDQRKTVKVEGEWQRFNTGPNGGLL